MKKIIILLSLTVLFLNSASQEHILKFDTEKIILPEGIIIEDIIDARDEKVYVGYVFKSGKVPVKIEKPIKDIILDITGNEKISDDDDNIILKINKLLIYENIYNNVEVSVCEMNISFILKADNKYIEMFEAGSYVKSSSSIDVTHKHPKNFKKALYQCIEDYVIRKNSNKLYAKYISIKELSTSSLYNNKYPIEKTQNLVKGIYTTFYDFRDQTPNTEKEFDIIYKNKKNQITKALIKDKSGNLINDVWGFTDGKHNYIKLANDFFPIIEENGNYILSDYPPEFQANLASASIIGGLFFSVIVAATEEKGKYKLDLRSSRFKPEKADNRLKFESRIIVLSSSFNKEDDVSEIIINETGYSLKPGEYVVSRNNSNTEEVTICAQIKGNKKCFTVEPTLFNTQLYLLKIKKNKISLLKPPIHVRSELIKKIRSGEFKEVKK